ncbi:MAG: nucleotidyltransferase family protein [Bacteroidota bacterium]|nr:nucleotidyltransferase family protein [Bacteroidota bacterium]
MKKIKISTTINSKKKNDIIGSTLRKHRRLLKKYTVRRIGLFGSHARGNQKKRSDIDFIVEFSKPSFDNFMDLLFSLESIFGKKVDLITKGNLSPYIMPHVEKEIKWYEV